MTHLWELSRLIATWNSPSPDILYMAVSVRSSKLPSWVQSEIISLTSGLGIENGWTVTLPVLSALKNNQLLSGTVGHDDNEEAVSFCAWKAMCSWSVCPAMSQSDTGTNASWRLQTTDCSKLLRRSILSKCKQGWGASDLWKTRTLMDPTFLHYKLVFPAHGSHSLLDSKLGFHLLYSNKFKCW